MRGQIKLKTSGLYHWTVAPLLLYNWVLVGVAVHIHSTSLVSIVVVLYVALMSVLIVGRLFVGWLFSFLWTGILTPKIEIPGFASFDYNVGFFIHYGIGLGNAFVGFDPVAAFVTFYTLVAWIILARRSSEYVAS